MLVSPPMAGLISGELADALQRMNPWWRGQAGVLLPPHRRHLVAQIRRRLDQRLAQIVVVRGSRQIGKTTAQLQIIEDLLQEGVAAVRIFRVQFDELEALLSMEIPIFALVRWFEEHVLKATLNEAARSGAPALLFFDEVQNLPTWAPQLKLLVDHSTVQVVVTGSSALRIELGRDSLAGRITTIEAGTLSLTEIAALRDIELGRPFLADNGLEPLTRLEFWESLREHGRARADPRDLTFRHFSERGGYPLMHLRSDVPMEALASQLNETVIRRVIQHDLGVGDEGRDGALLEEVFRIACRHVGQTPSLQTFVNELSTILNANIKSEMVWQYLQFLADTLLLRLVEPLEIRLKKKASSAKICLTDHALRASWLHEEVPLVPEGLADMPALATMAGYLAESVVGATLSTINALALNYSPERKDQRELDFVMTIGTKRIPIEVKYQRSPDPVRDTQGLRSFIDKAVNNAPFGILVTQRDTDVDFGPGVLALPLSTLMLLR